MSMGLRIRELRIKKHFTQDDLADMLGVKRPTVANYEANRINPSMEILNKIANILSTNTDYLIGRSDDPAPNQKPTINKVPLVGSICAGDGLLAEHNIEELVFYPFPNKAQPDFALRVEGDSMINVGIEDGDIVYMRQARWAEFNGQIVAAIVNGDEGTLKRIKWSEGDPVFKLIPENKEYTIIEKLPHEFQICGVYAGHFKPERQL